MSDWVWFGGKEHVDARYHNGSGALAFRIPVKHGSGKRLICFELPVAALLKFAEVFRGVPPDEHGHAFHRFERNEGPCGMCGPELTAKLATTPGDRGEG